MINTSILRIANPLGTCMLALVLGAFVLSPASFAGATPATLGIDISKFAFEPKEVTVAPGTKIIWSNHDESPHTVTSQDKTFTSKALDTDDTYEYTFNGEGDFDYYCTVHPFMNGIVHVRKQ
jgi:plastocyanin